MSSPTILIIFGATGDLVHKKIIPSLYSLYKEKALPNVFKVIAFARRDFNDGKYNEIIKESLREYAKVDLNTEDISEFCNMFMYHHGDFDDLESYNSMVSKIHAMEKEWNDCSNKLFYLAVPPESYKNLLTHINSSGATRTCVKEGSFARIIVEKPFGHDYKTALELNQLVTQLFSEEQIYRIDHYLGKHIVREIINFRQNHQEYEKIWNKENIIKVEIITLEDFGVEKRGDFYDPLGTLRDVGQNHLLTIAAMIAQEINTNDLESERLKVLQNLKIFDNDETKKYTYRAQHKGYTQIKGVKPNSKTETYFKAIAYIENLRWKDVPFALEAGKSFKESIKQVIIHFKDRDLIFDLLTDEIIEIKDNKKKVYEHGERPKLQYVGEYAVLLKEVIEGNEEFFPDFNEVAASWKFVDAIEDAWIKDVVPLNSYEIGSERLVTGI